MFVDLPDFNYLKKLAEEDPEELDFLCHFYSRQLIDNAPEKYQKRLNGILFQIEATKRRCKNPLHRCISISKMMMDSFENLQVALTEVVELDLNAPHGNVTKKEIPQENNIINFPAEDMQD
ncbi:hypothetical protein MNBD_GAMMA11-364 [hydrothermal vent metagenome]|uniref:DUF3135 domain-containing protein n=1 Tax=hydrothermal vent metagenome TaxID=652676 RepID=A0A3B0X7V8_9ZZZZ